MSIASEIARLQQAKADLKTAINSKGGNITTERIDQFASEVASLPSPKEEEEKILTPDFSTGNHVIVPTTDRVLSQVTLTKPADLLPGNIAKDVNICGVVGTLESGETDPLITLYALHSWNTPSGTNSGTITWSIPDDILDSLYCVMISDDQFRFYKLTDCYLVGASVGSTTYTKRLNTATGTLTRNTSTNGTTIGFDIINYPAGNISPGRVGLLPILAPSKHVKFTLDRDLARLTLKRYQIPKSVLLQYYPDFSDDMIGLITFYDRDVRVTTLPWLL